MSVYSPVFVTQRESFKIFNCSKPLNNIQRALFHLPCCQTTEVIVQEVIKDQIIPKLKIVNNLIFDIFGQTSCIKYAL